MKKENIQHLADYLNVSPEKVEEALNNKPNKKILVSTRLPLELHAWLQKTYEGPVSSKVVEALEDARRFIESPKFS